MRPPPDWASVRSNFASLLGTVVAVIVGLVAGRERACWFLVRFGEYVALAFLYLGMPLPGALFPRNCGTWVPVYVCMYVCMYGCMM